MKVIEVQSTPNPNAMKFILDQTVSERPISFFNPESGRDHPLAARLFEIPEVQSVLLLNDFVTINKTPQGLWKTITPAVKRVLSHV